MADAPAQPELAVHNLLSPSKKPPYFVGRPIEFTGYVDDFERAIAGIEFSLDGGSSWTPYATEAVDKERGVRWRFVYTPQKPGRYLLKARAVGADGLPSSSLVTGFAFEVLPAMTMFGSARVRAIGGGTLGGGCLFRSRELVDITPDDAIFLARSLGISTIYDMRTRREVAAHPEPYLVGTKTIALEPAEERRKKDADKRLVAGVIGAYGAPEERMCENYRRYVREYPLIGQALRSMAAEGTPALAHCVNGKDRTGVLCAVLLKAAQFDDSAVMEDYLRVNQDHADLIAEEAERLGVGMTARERAILMSFLEARPAYLAAFFDEAAQVYGSFEGYVRRGLRLTDDHIASLRALLLPR